MIRTVFAVLHGLTFAAAFTVLALTADAQPAAPNYNAAPAAQSPALPGTTAPKAPASADLTTVTLTQPTNYTTPADTLARLPELANHPDLKDLPVNRVRLSGRTTGRPGTDGATVTIDWSRVTLDDSSKSASLPAPLTTRLKTGQTVIPSDQPFKARGDVPGLVKTIKELFSADTDATAKTDTKDKAAAPTTAKTSSPQNAGGSPPVASSSTPTNDIAGNFKPLDYTPAAEKTESPTAHGTKPCEPRYDWGNSVVYFQNKPTETKDGITTEGTCSDSGEQVPIQRDYALCPDTVKVSEKVAIAGYKPFYVDKTSGATKEIGSCTPDSQQTFPITNDTTRCGLSTDYSDGFAKQQSELTYTNYRNQRVVYDTCAVHDGDAKYPVSETAEGCSIRHDFAAKKSYKQTKKVYTKDSLQTPLTACADTTTTYVHVLDKGLCQAVVDKSAKLYVETAQTRIDTENGSQYLTACQPTGTGLAISETFAGCETRHTDNFATGQSILWTKWTKNTDGAAVTECAESANIATHDFVRNGWVNDDALRQATEKLEVYIALPQPVGRTMIDAANVRPQSAVTPYTFTSQSTTPTGASTYPGNACTAYRTTALSDIYTRPDGTTYTNPIGPGSPIGPIDVCMTTTIASGQFSTGYANVSSSCSPGGDQSGGSVTDYIQHVYSATVNKNQKKNSETGAVISTACAFATASGWKQMDVAPGGSTCTGGPGGEFKNATTNTVEAGSCPTGF